MGPFVDTNDIRKKEIYDTMRGLTHHNQSLLMNITYDDMTIRLPVEKWEYLTKEEDFSYKKPSVDSTCFETYGDGDLKCFTHDIEFTKGTSWG